MVSTAELCLQPARRRRSPSLVVAGTLIAFAMSLACIGEAAAETYAAEHPSDAKILVRRLFDLSAGDIDYIWPLHNLHVSLPQGLLFVLEQQAEWRVRKKLTNAAAMPNYLDFVATDPLRDIRESSVGIVK